MGHQEEGKPGPAEDRERLDRREGNGAPAYDPPFLARLWLFVAVLVAIGLIAGIVTWISGS